MQVAFYTGALWAALVCWSTWDEPRSPPSDAARSAAVDELSPPPEALDSVDGDPEGVPLESASLYQGNEHRASVDADLAQDLANRLADIENRLRLRDDADRKAAEAAAKKFRVRPFGRIHIDAVSFNQSEANRAVVGDARNGVDIRRARLGVEGEGFDTFFYRFDVDFVTFDQASQQRPVIVDAYLDAQNLPVLKNVRVGHFREPFSLERLDSSHDLPFLERTAPINTLTPFRNIGIMPFGWNDDETVTWAYGIFAENTNEFGEQVTDRTGLSFTTRVTTLPWYDEYSEGRSLWHIGASYSYRNLSNPQRQFSQVPEVQLKEDGSSRTPNWVNTGLLSIDDYHVMGLETTTVLGSLSIQGEYVGLFANQTNGDTAYLHGGYLEALYFLTGENRNYIRKQGTFGAVTPYSNFYRARTDNGIETGTGAWEVGARVSNVDLIGGNVQGGDMLNMTLGLNWYYAVRSRVMFNYIHSFLDRGGVDSTADMFATRFQFAF